MAGETLVSLVPPRVRLVNGKPGKFAGRFVATIMADTRDLAEAFRGKRASASLKPGRVRRDPTGLASLKRC